MLQTSKLELVHRFWFLNMRCGNRIWSLVKIEEWECRYLHFWKLLWQLKISLWSPFILQVLIHCCGYSCLTFGGKWIFQREFPEGRSDRVTHFQTRGILSYTDAVPPGNNQYHTILTPYHQVPSSYCSTTLNWPSTTKYQSVGPYTDQVPLSTIQYRPMLTQYH